MKKYEPSVIIVANAIETIALHTGANEIDILEAIDNLFLRDGNLNSRKIKEYFRDE